MVKTVIELLENSTKKYKNKIAFGDIKEEITYSDFTKESKKLGTYLVERNLYNKPIGIFIDKNINALFPYLEQYIVEITIQF